MPASTPAARRPVLRSISGKIAFFAFLSVLTTAGIISGICIQSTYSTLRAELDQRFTLQLERTAAELSRWTDEGQGTLAGLAASNRFPSAPELTEWLAESLHFDAVARVDERGVRARAGAAWEPTTTGSARKDVVWQPGPNSAGRPVARLPVPSRPGSWIVARFTRSGLQEALYSEGAGIPGALTLLDRSGRAAAQQFARPAAQQEDLQPRPPDLAAFELAEMAPGRVVGYASRDGQWVLGSALEVASLGGSLILEEPLFVAFAPLVSLLTRVLVLDFAIVAFFTLLAYRIAHRIMQPIRELSEGAERIATGQIDYEIPALQTAHTAQSAQSRDEIGRLSSAFNDMIRKLRRNQLEIEEQNALLTRQYQELLDANEVLAQLSITDGLTKLHNHRFFQDHLTREIKRVSRTTEPLSMLLMDLDDFKRLNDRMGHAAGDELLVRIAQTMSESIREIDLLARYGGEEFVVLAPSTDLEGAVGLGEKIRMAVEELVVLLDVESRPTRVTISVGVAVFAGDRRAFFQSADRALYQAKANGKNCVVSATA